MSQNPPSYLVKLRTATQASHKELEQITESESAINGIDLEWYTHFLKTHLYHHKVIADHLTKNHIEDILDWPKCRRISALEQDLLQLTGYASDNNSFIPLPSNTFAFAVGLCYVSEGSCMGNQMMYKHFRSDEQFQSWQASSFFKECANEWGMRWKAFRAIMDEVGNSNYEELEKGAIFGFQRFGKLWKKDQSNSINLFK